MASLLVEHTVVSQGFVYCSFPALQQHFSFITSLLHSVPEKSLRVSPSFTSTYLYICSAALLHHVLVCLVCDLQVTQPVQIPFFNRLWAMEGLSGQHPPPGCWLSPSTVAFVYTVCPFVNRAIVHVALRCRVVVMYMCCSMEYCYLLKRGKLWKSLLGFQLCTERPRRAVS